MQPKPVPNEHPASWDIVLRNLRNGFQGAPMLEKVCEDIRKRDEQGRLKYGVRLQPFNGRDSLQDAYEEALDFTVYIRNVLTEDPENEDVYQIYRGSLITLMRVRELIDRKGKT